MKKRKILIKYFLEMQTDNDNNLGPTGSDSSSLHCMSPYERTHTPTPIRIRFDTSSTHCCAALQCARVCHVRDGNGLRLRIDLIP